MEENRLLNQSERLAEEQAQLFEQKQVVEETVDHLFNTYLIEKTEQVERIEERLEGLVNNQMVKLQSLQNNRPGFLSLPSTKNNWNMNVQMAQVRLNSLQDRLEDIREIREGMVMGGPKLQELAMRKLRREEPDLMEKFDEIQTALRVHRLHEKQRQEKKVQHQGLSQTLTQSLSL